MAPPGPVSSDYLAILSKEIEFKLSLVIKKKKSSNPFNTSDESSPLYAVSVVVFNLLTPKSAKIPEKKFKSSKIKNSWKNPNFHFV